MEGLANTMQTWEIAIYGFLCVIAMSVIQYFITAYFRKAEKLKDDEITKVFQAISELNDNVKTLTEKISEHSIQLALCKEKMTGIEIRLQEHERRLNSKN